MKKIFLSALTTLIVCSCQNFRNEIKEMQELNNELQKEFNIKDFKIQIMNNTSLQVSVINSSYNDSADDVKQKLTDSIGIISLKYIHSVKLTGGTVAFVLNKNYAGIVNTSRSNSFPMHLN